MSVRDAQASNWVAERADATGSVFDLKGSSKSYTSFSRAFSAGDTVFYSAHDEQGNREAGYGVFNGSTELTRNPTATLVNNVYSSSSPSEVSFSGEVTVACTFNASAFNTLWKALDAIDPDGDGGINIPPELIDGLLDTLNGKADQVDLEKEIQDRIDGDKALQDQIDALDPDGDLVIDWSEIEGKPSDYPPSSHGHVWSEITEKPTEFPPSAHSQGWDTITGKPADYPPSSHGHEIDEVNGLQDALDAAGGTPAWDDVTGKPTEFPPAAHNQDWGTITNTPSEYPPEAHTHQQGDVDGLEVRLDAIEDSITSGGGFVDAPDDGKLYGRQSEAWAEVVIPDVADPDWSDIQNKPTEFPPSAHGHEIAEINGLDDALTDAGAPTAWDDVTGKPTEFPPEDHTHLVADITDFDPADYQPVGNYATEQYVDDAIADIDLSDASLWEQNGNDIYYDSGNVGIGTDNPTVTASASAALEISGPSGGNLVLSGTNASAGEKSKYLLSQGGTLYVGHSADDGTSPVNDLTIDADGNVGIGTDNPVHAVDIDGNLSLGGANPFIAFTPTAGSGVTPTYIQRYGSDMVFYNNGTGADGTMSWNVGTGGVEAMRIDANGNVGIGGSANSFGAGVTTLQLTGSASGAPTRSGALRFRSQDTTSSACDIYSDNGFMSFYTGTSTTTTERMRIDANGNVGIGTDLPTSELHLRVRGENNGAQITFDSDYGIGYVGQENNANNNLIIGSSTAGVTFYSNNTERMNLDSTGRLGIGGTPSRSAGEIAKEAKDKLARWRSTFDERLKAEPKADKKAITLEITDDEFSTFPTEETLVERLQERNIGGGAAKLQVAGDGYFSGDVEVNKNLVVGKGSSETNKFGIFSGANYTGFQQVGSDFAIRLQGNAATGVSFDADGSATFPGTVAAGAVNAVSWATPGGTGYIQINGSNTVELRSTIIFPYNNNAVDLGRSDKNWKDGYFSGTIYGTVADVPAHVKAITPTQIANWDAGTGGGGGGATTDGRISDTQIANWDTAFGWGNHASAGYQPAGSYLTASDLSGYATESWVTSNYQPRGSYLTSSDLNGYATESWVNSQGFAKGSFVPTSGNTTISGTLTATDFVASSDERLKQNTVTAPTGVVDQLRGVEFEWREDGRQSAGVIAQEVEKVLPHLVHNNGEYKAVNYNGLVAYLIEEIKDLKKQVQELSK